MHLYSGFAGALHSQKLMPTRKAASRLPFVRKTYELLVYARGLARGGRLVE